MPESCLTNPKIQEARSLELKQAYQADQEDRSETESHMDSPAATEKLFAIARRDQARRERVAAIFAEGCFRSASDYGYAAMIFQHGTVPDHYFQSFVWSKTAVDLGERSHINLLKMAVDRYLMSIKKKQLFGTQANKIKALDACWCLWPMEESFTGELNKKYEGKTKLDALAWVKKMNGSNLCPEQECVVSASATTKGSIPGFW